VVRKAANYCRLFLTIQAFALNEKIALRRALKLAIRPMGKILPLRKKGGSG
jgi:hypothetical protein